MVIEKYPDKIVMANPGTIITGKQQMLKGGISQPRNKGLFKMFNLIGLGEHAGSGVPDIFHAWKETGLEEPTVEEKFGNPDRTVLTLPLISSIYDITTSTRAGEIYLHPGEEKGEENRAKTIIKIMAENPKASMSMIAKKTGLTKRQIEKTIMSLKESGKIHREGPDKGGRWVIE